MRINRDGGAYGRHPHRFVSADLVIATASIGAAMAIAACSAVQPTPSGAVNHIDGEAIASSLVEFAQARDASSFAEIPFGADVILALGGEALVDRPHGELADPEAWVVDPGPNGFRDRSGPFSALDVIASTDTIAIAVGRLGSCVSGDPQPMPDGLTSLHVISLQPSREGSATCMDWWSVDIFVTDAGRVEGIDLDRGAP